jgi:hypothetical protein
LFVWLLSFENWFSGLLFNLLSLSFTDGTQVVGFPLALSLSAVFQFVLLYFMFKRKLKEFNSDAKH